MDTVPPVTLSDNDARELRRERVDKFVHALQKGDEISFDAVCEMTAHLSFGDGMDTRSNRGVRCRTIIEKSLRRLNRGRETVRSYSDGTVRILTDADASAWNNQRHKQGRARIRRAYNAQTGVERSQLTHDQQLRHDESLRKIGRDILLMRSRIDPSQLANAVRTESRARPTHKP